jgi:hypothetical protein
LAGYFHFYFISADCLFILLLGLFLLLLLCYLFLHIILEAI